METKTTESVFENFTNQYSLTKTLRFELKPTPETRSLAEVIKEDKEVDRLYNEEMKPMFDRLHEEFITESLEGANLPVNILGELEKKLVENKELRRDKKLIKAEIYELENKKKGEIDILQKTLREEIVEFFNEKGNEWREKKYSKLKLKKEGYKILTEAKILDVLKMKNPEKNEVIEKFGKFFTYFSGFSQNRENYYSSEEKATGVANRIINENLARFLENKQKFKDVSEKAPQLKKYEESFKLENYKKYLTQAGIEKFNLEVVGEINKELNLFSQQNRNILPKTPKFKVLYKQIGCGKKIFDLFSISIGEEWQKLEELRSVKENEKSFNQKELLVKIKQLFESFFANLDSYELDRIYFNKSSINTISSLWFVNWHKLAELLSNKKIIKNKNKETGEYTIPKKIALIDLKEVLEAEKNIEDLFKKGKIDPIDAQKENPKGIYEKNFSSDGWKTFVAIWKYEIDTNFRNLEKKIKEFEIKKQTKFGDLDKKERTVFVKEFCDAFLSIERMVKYHRVDESDEKDDSFYETIDLYLQGTKLNKYYDAFRNYLTKKPFSEDKLKLNFKSGTLLGGWAQSFETYGSLIFENDGEYFLGIINGTKFSDNELARIYNKSSESIKARRLLYNTQKIDNKNPPRWFIRSKKTTFAPMVREGLLNPKNILELYDKKLYSKGENKTKYKEYLPKLLDYFKEGFLKHKDFVAFKRNFKWLDSGYYDTVVDFYNHTADMCYKTEWEDIDFTELTKLTEEGRIYLFKIYNKDFAEKSKGAKNLHTMLFLELLKPENNIKLKLLGGGEIFYREKSINKKVDKERSFKTDKFEIIKNKRYSEEKYFLHFPIEIKGRKLKGSFNQNINQELRKADVNILGIDRGEKHLLYYSLINNKGRVIKQGSLNKIKVKKPVDEKKIVEKYDNNSKLEEIKLENTGKKIDYVDYHLLLSYYEKKRILARQSWDTIGKIKDLKAGYLSQVVHEIYKLIIEHNAIIVLEDLNSEFKAKRTAKVEKSVYKKFELALARKLNHLILKNKKADEKGGVLDAYQLTPAIGAGDVGKFEKAKQWGVMFYVRPDYTSQTDPVTGWRKTIYISNSETIPNIKKKWMEAGIGIDFDTKKNCFRFSHGKWNLYAYNELERLYWNRNEKNLEGGFGNMKRYNLHKEFKNLFSGLDTLRNINEQIINKADFNWKNLIFYWNLLNQIRNTDKSKNGDENDFIQSPIWSDKINDFYDSHKKYQIELPKNGDANGAYNIARKGIMLLDRIKEEPQKPDLFIKNTDWDSFAQK